MNQNRSPKFNRRQIVAASLGAAGFAAAGATPSLARAQSDKPLAGKKVLVAIGEFSEGLETYYIVYRLVEEGIQPVVAAAEVKRVLMVVHDFEPEFSNYTEKLGYFIQSDIAYQDVNPAEFDGMIIPGGRGPEEIRQYEDVLKITRYFIDNDLPLGAMCHGPQVIYSARPMKGRRIAAYDGIRADVELAGATFVNEPVAVDKKMVTSRGWPDLPYFMPKFLEVLA
jgi:protease I